MAFRYSLVDRLIREYRNENCTDTPLSVLEVNQIIMSVLDDNVAAMGEGLKSEVGKFLGFIIGLERTYGFKTMSAGVDPAFSMVYFDIAWPGEFDYSPDDECGDDDDDESSTVDFDDPSIEYDED